MSVVLVVNRSNPISRGWGENMANVIMVFKISVLNEGERNDSVIIPPSWRQVFFFIWEDESWWMIYNEGFRELILANGAVLAIVFLGYSRRAVVGVE